MSTRWFRCDQNDASGTALSIEGAGNELRGALSASDRSFDRAGAPFRVIRFAGEPQRSVDRAAERLGGVVATDTRVAVCAASERILRPIMEVTGAEAALECASRGVEDSSDGGDRCRLDVVAGLSHQLR